ncbi:MAG: GNAT family N-acetyltransferase [Deltaproteobacteria bacterium]|nr:MAG: GNAT family N-acetyltransferase [Deltaproteobacteria bacterium]
MLLPDGRTATIRPVVFKDSEALNRVEAAIVRAGDGVVIGPDEIRDVRSTMDRVGAFLDAGDLLLVAEVDGVIVGSIDVRRIPLLGLRHNGDLTMGLVPEVQGLGLGRALLHEALLWCRREGVTRVQLACLADNPRALRLYEGAGFQTVHVREAFLRWPDGREIDDVMMELRLDTPLVVCRPSRTADAARIHAIHAAAFPTDAEARLVDALVADGADELSRVLTVDGEVVAHALFTALTHEPTEGAPVEGILGLAPIAVDPAHQRRGHGSRLIRDCLAALARRDVPAVALLGDPAYYPRFGFTPAADRGIRWTHDVDPAAFMVLELAEGSLAPGLLRYHRLIEGL